MTYMTSNNGQRSPFEYAHRQRYVQVRALLKWPGRQRAREENERHEGWLPQPRCYMRILMYMRHGNPERRRGNESNYYENGEKCITWGENTSYIVVK